MRKHMEKRNQELSEVKKKIKDKKTYGEKKLRIEHR